MELRDKVIIITGASSGIGREIAHALVKEQPRLVLAARNQDNLDRSAAALRAEGGSVLAVSTDVTKEADCQNLVQAVLAEYGQIDVLINNAGYAPPASLQDTTEAIWDVTIDVCLKGVYLMTRAVLPTMLNQNSGTMVNISSVAGKQGFENRSAYCAAKWGVHGFTEALRVELRHQDIFLHLICPGAVATPWWETINNPQSEEVLARMIPPEEVAEAVFYVLTRPDHLQIDEVMIKTRQSPWTRP